MWAIERTKALADWVTELDDDAKGSYRHKPTNFEGNWALAR
jgi:hypothetical protein